MFIKAHSYVSLYTCCRVAIARAVWTKYKYVWIYTYNYIARSI